jgi:hypothetical protein
MCRRRASKVVVSALVVLTGCGADAEPPKMFLSLDVVWDDAPADRQAFGYGLTMTLSQWRAGDRCDAWPAPISFVIDDEQVGPPIPDPNSGCIDFNVVLGPMLDVPETVTARYETEGRQVATATYRRLAPGLAAALVVPVDGQARAGDEVVVVPPPELPTSVPSNTLFYPLDEARASSWPEYGVRPSELATRLPDGIHVKVPPLTGRVALVVDDNYLPFREVEISCDGFAGCSGKTSAVVGPVYLTVQP